MLKMASGGEPRRGPEEADWSIDGDDVCFSFAGPLRSEELSLALPLTSKNFGRGTSDEGYPLSPEVPDTPREDLIADIKKLEDRMNKVLGVLASWANLTESTQNEQQVLIDRFEQVQQEHVDLKQRYRELARIVERLEDRLKMEEERKKDNDDKVVDMVKKEVRKEVREEMEKRKSEYREEIKQLFEEQKKKSEKEVQLHVRKLEVTKLMLEKQVSEVEEARLQAERERDVVKEKFQVTKAKLQEEKVKNSLLLRKIQELEQRCQRLEEENSHLRLQDIFRQTNFIPEGQMLECFSCRQEYSTNQNDEGCCYHPVHSMPYDSWRSVIPNEELPSNLISSNQASRFRYWACCNVLASRRPEGCCHGRHHQQWEMDIMMRQVLVDGAEHSAFMNPLKVY